MVWFILLAVAGAAVAGYFAFASARQSLAGLQDTVRGAWPGVEAACVKRAELVGRIVALCARPLEDRPEMRERVTRSGAAVLEAVRRGDTLSLAAADQAHRTAVAELLGRARSHPQFAGSDAFAALVDRVATLESRIDAERERYNDLVGVFNLRRGSLPFRLAAHGIPRGEFL